MRLRLYADEDMWLTEAMECDPQVMAHLGGPLTPADIPPIHKRRVVHTDDPGGYFVIIPDESTGAVGTVGIWPLDWNGTTIYETGWMLLPAFQGRTIASEALAMVLDSAKADPRIDAVHAFPNVENPASNAICRKFGFELLGRADGGYRGEPFETNHWRLDMSTYRPRAGAEPATFVRRELHNARFERVDLTGASFVGVDLANVSIRSSNLTGLRVRGSDLVDIELNGWLDGSVRINGVDVTPLVEVELNRRHPDRAKMRPTTPDGFREAWDVLERLWRGTVERARRLDPAVLHESVDGEWSFIETLRHLVFATDAWVRRAMLGDPAPWHPLDLPWDEMPDTPGIPRDREVRPSLAEVLELRADRMATVRRVVDELTVDRLAESTEPVDGPGWPPPESFPVHECLLTILNEEWEHRMYAERDLAVLEQRG